MAREKKIFFSALLLTTLACGTAADQVCEDVGLCRGQTDDQITACQQEAKALTVEARASGCGTQLEGYFGCADSRYACAGNVPSFPGCDALRAILDQCLASTRAGNSCGILDGKLAACPSGSATGFAPAPCSTIELCTSRCFLDSVSQVCRPQPVELVDFAHCVQQCP